MTASFAVHIAMLALHCPLAEQDRMINKAEEGLLRKAPLLDVGADAKPRPGAHRAALCGTRPHSLSIGRTSPPIHDKAGHFNVLESCLTTYSDILQYDTVQCLLSRDILPLRLDRPIIYNAQRLIGNTFRPLPVRGEMIRCEVSE